MLPVVLTILHLSSYLSHAPMLRNMAQFQRWLAHANTTCHGAGYHLFSQRGSRDVSV
jgi:hypothetical protein